MSYLLEMTVLEWVRKTSLSLDERIIRYEYGFGNRKKVVFKELDYILKVGENYFLGEIKVSSIKGGMAPKAKEQLSYSKELLSYLSDSPILQIIKIDLNFLNSQTPLDEFCNDFLDSKFRTYIYDQDKFEILHLSAQDVFNYGVINNIIKSPELFAPVIFETNILHEKRGLKVEINDLKRLLASETDYENLCRTQAVLSQYELSLFLCEIELRLSQEGWVYLSDKDHIDYEFIIDYLGGKSLSNVLTNEIKTRSNGFHSEDQIAKYISYYCNFGEVEFQLLDAERVYCRLSDEQQCNLQNIKFKIDNVLQYGKSSYPLLSKKQYRKFYYAGNLVNQKDNDNDSLKQFELIIKNSLPIKILLKPNNILILDNHRLLYKNNKYIDSQLYNKVIID